MTGIRGVYGPSAREASGRCSMERIPWTFRIRWEPLCARELRRVSQPIPSDTDSSALVVTRGFRVRPRRLSEGGIYSAATLDGLTALNRFQQGLEAAA